MDLNPQEASDKNIVPPFHKTSKEAEIAPELAPLAGDVVVPKNRWNSFYQTALELHFRVRGIKTMIIAGGSTDVGIASTVYAARDELNAKKVVPTPMTVEEERRWGKIFDSIFKGR
jgi:nicotinamidase-related amidase